MLYAFFWIISRRLKFICRRFGTLCLFHLHRQVGVKNEHSPHLPAYEDGKDSVLKRPHIKFRRRGITQKKAYNKKNKNNNLYETNIKDSPPHFYEIQEEYKVLLFETNSQIKNNRDLYRGTNELQKGYQPRTNIVKVKQGDLVTNSHSTWARWRNHFSQLLNVQDRKSVV